MRSLAAAAAVLGLALALALAVRAAEPRASSSSSVVAIRGNAPGSLTAMASVAAPAGIAAPAPDALNEVIRSYCQGCHNSRMNAGNMSLESFDVTAAPQQAAVAEKIIAKLRAQMMPPPGARRPSPDTLLALAEYLETSIDRAADARIQPGSRSFQRLNRAEYTHAIRDLLGLDIDAGTYLPLDTKSDNFDNIAAVQVLSPLLLAAYLRAASEISWLAVGNPRATPAEATYTVPRTASQMEHVEGAPFGTRGGVAATHTFAADGEYVFRVSFYHETTGAFAGGNARGEQIE
ncbi:MAG TPA: DUF1587 domain-containing protein, partial [Longimicrobiales bacterium]|nr:DUF1587 domain-containing protein [Longimicrobiales bacterium]